MKKKTEDEATASKTTRIIGSEEGGDFETLAEEILYIELVVLAES